MFQDRLRLLVAAKTKHIAEKRIEKIRSAVSSAARLWRNHVKRVLSVRWPGRKMDYPDGSVPYMRTGKLRNAVPRFRTVVLKTAGGNKLNPGEAAIKLQRIDHKAPWDTYGDTLNRRKDGLGGWQDRAQQALRDKISERLGFTKGFSEF